jgi:hypothetical protein
MQIDLGGISFAERCEILKMTPYNKSLEQSPKVRL